MTDHGGVQYTQLWYRQNSSRIHLSSPTIAGQLVIIGLVPQLDTPSTFAGTME